MTNNKKFILTVCLLIGLYALFLVGIKLYDNGENAAPVITIDNEILTVSVKDNENALLSGVSASDAEDGDLSSKIVIDSISEFDEKNYRIVTYIVFDNNDQMAKAIRRIKYSDYEAPKLDIEKALVYFYMPQPDMYKEYISAYSVLDGNLNSKIIIENIYYEKDLYVVFSVTDSCGIKSSITLKADETNGFPSVDFKLNDYMVQVGKGIEIDPWIFIDHIEYMGMDLTNNIENISIQNNYDPTTEGMYEFIYRYTDETGEFGITKLVVIVE